MCILLYLKLIWWSGIPYIYGQLEEGGLGLCAFCHMLKLGGVVVSIHLWSIGGGGHWYVCILVYVKLILCRGISIHLWSIGGGGPWVYLHSAICETYSCSGIPQLYGQLEEGVLGRCAFCYMLNLCGVVIFLTSMVDQGSTSALSICAFCYMLNLFVVVVFHRSMVNWRRGGLGICAFCYMLNLCGVVVFHTSMVDWRGYICPEYMCILLYVKLIWCSGIPQIYGQLEEGALVDVHSAIC